MKDFYPVLKTIGISNDIIPIKIIIISSKVKMEDNVWLSFNFSLTKSKTGLKINDRMEAIIIYAITTFT